MRAAGIVAVLALTAVISASAGSDGDDGAADRSAIEVRTERIERFEIGRSARRFGGLEFRGGLVLSGPFGFGGLSGLVLDGDGSRLVAVSDLGHWLTARLEAGPDGTLTGLAETRWFRRLTPDGRPPVNKRKADAEALALRPSGSRPLLVAVENEPYLLAYPMPPTAAAVPQRVALPPERHRTIVRHGIEALAVVPGPGAHAGAIFLATETAGPGESGAWLVSGGHARPIALARDPEWAITGADFLPDGDLVIVERRFRRPIWVGMRIRRVARQQLGGAGPIRGSVLIEADLSHEIDNMEAIAAHRGPGGRTFLTLLSDDNRSLLQRTLILRFELGTPRPSPRPAMMIVD